MTTEERCNANKNEMLCFVEYERVQSGAIPLLSPIAIHIRNDSCEKKIETSTIITVVECKSFPSVDGSKIASHAKWSVQTKKPLYYIFCLHISF